MCRSHALTASGRMWAVALPSAPAFWMVVRARTAAGPLHVWHVMVAAWSQTVACRVMGLNPALGAMSRQARRSLPTRIHASWFSWSVSSAVLSVIGGSFRVVRVVAPVGASPLTRGRSGRVTW